MAQIIVLTKEAKQVLQKIVRAEIDRIEGDVFDDHPEENTLHAIYSDIVSKKFVP